MPCVVTPRQVVKLMRPSETAAQASLRAQIREQKELLNSMSMVDEFASYARVERKLKRLQDELSAIGECEKGQSCLIFFFICLINFHVMQYRRMCISCAKCLALKMEF